MIKRVVKDLLMTLAPRVTASWVAARARARSHRLFKEWGLFDLNCRLVRAAGSRALGGPFQGLVFSPMTYGEHIGPYILGTYEFELHPWWDEITRKRFAQIIDVGAKVGYYAIGLARKYPDAAVVAFDIDPWARRAVREMIAENGVNNVTVESFCSPDWMRKHLQSDALIVSDCEGYEGALFSDPSVAGFRSATLLIETHDNVCPGVTAELCSRFASSHTVTTIEASDSPPELNVAAVPLSSDELARAAREVRGAQTWVLLRPRSSAV